MKCGSPKHARHECGCAQANTRHDTRFVANRGQGRSGRCAKTPTCGSCLNHENSGSEWPGREVTMRSPLLFGLVIAALVTVGTLAVMNNACKSSQHAWCAPTSSLRHHIKTG